MIAAGPAAIAAASPASRCCSRRPRAVRSGCRSSRGAPITRSIDVQDEDEFQTSLSASHLRFPHERSTTVRAGGAPSTGVTDRLPGDRRRPYTIRDPAGAHG